MSEASRAAFDMPAQALLGPALDTHTPESFQAHVMSLKELSTWKRPAKRAPKPRVEHPTHKLAETLNAKGKAYTYCLLCGAKSRSTKTKCRKVPITQEGTDA